MTDDHELYEERFKTWQARDKSSEAALEVKEYICMWGGGHAGRLDTVLGAGAGLLLRAWAQPKCDRLGARL